MPAVEHCTAVPMTNPQHTSKACVQRSDDSGIGMLAAAQPVSRYDPPVESRHDICLTLAGA